jgi:hypothetical protein
MRGTATCGFSTGARNNLWSRVRRYMWCAKSSSSFACSSLGPCILSDHSSGHSTRRCATHPVRAIAICVILAAVLYSIMQDGRRECVRLVAQETAAIEARVVLVVTLRRCIWRGGRVVQGHRPLLRVLLGILADLYSAVLACGMESERRRVGLGRAGGGHAERSISFSAQDGAFI